MAQGASATGVAYRTGEVGLQLCLPDGYECADLTAYGSPRGPEWSGFWSWEAHSHRVQRLPPPGAGLQPTAHGPELARHLLVCSAVGAQPVWWHNVLGCFGAMMAESSRGGKERITHKTWNICFLACYRKSVLIPSSRANSA